MARKISQFSTYTWDNVTFPEAYIPIITPPKDEVINEDDIDGDYINYKFKPIDLFLTKYDSYNPNSLIVTDSSGKITFKTDFGGNKVLLSKEPGLIEESSITTEELKHLSGIESNIQNQLNNIKNDIQVQLNTKLPKNFSTSDAENKVVITDKNKNIIVSKITTDELNYLEDVDSNIQTQLNTKAPTYNPTFTGKTKAPTPDLKAKDTQIATAEFVYKSIDANKPVISKNNCVIISDSNRNIIASDVTTTELNYLKGVTSKIQDQLNSKLPSVLSGNNTDSKVLITNSSKQIGASSITTNELKCLANIKSNIQDQLDAKQTKGVSKVNMVLVSDTKYDIIASDISIDELKKLSNIRDNIQSQLNDLSSSCCMPDFTAGVSITSGEVVPCAALGVVAAGNRKAREVKAAINGVIVWSNKCADSDSAYARGSFLIPPNSTVTFDGNLTYYPLKRMQMLV